MWLKTMVDRHPTVWAGVGFCVALGFQVSGYTNVYLASGLWVIAAILVFYAVFVHLKTAKTVTNTAVPQPNMRLEEVVKKITGRTTLPGPNEAGSADVLRACEALREKAVNGLMTIFGGTNWRITRPADYDHMLRVAIPKDFWVSHRIDVIMFLAPGNEYRGITCDLTGMSQKGDYLGIWFDRDEVSKYFT
ncbi:MAG: hypothetical protein HYX46_02870 [Betaproteobacteria bacterium]|nr:hypothetical protein [Betaproteobacteria bacterium]